MQCCGVRVRRGRLRVVSGGVAFPKEWDEDKLKEVFGEFGTITSAILVTDGQGRKSFFANYETPEMAKAAIDKMHEKDMGADEEGEPQKMYVQKALSKKERERELRQKNAGGDDSSAGVNLFVKNLDEDLRDTAL